MDTKTVSAFFWEILPYCLVGGLGGSIVLGFLYLLTGRKSWATRSRSGRLVFALPLLMRLSMASLAVSFISLALGGLMQIYAHPYPYLPAQCVVVIAGLLILVLGIGCAYLSGPQRLDLDLESHRYTYTWGPPLFPRCVQGTFEDIKAFHVKPTADARRYHSRMAWRVPGRRDVILGVFDREEDAASFARDMLVLIRDGRTGGEVRLLPRDISALHWRRRL